MAKWSKYARKYKKEWEKEKWAQNWLKESTESINEAYCKVCKTTIRSHVSDLKKHSKSKIHENKMKALNPVANKQQLLPFTLEITNQEKERDILLAVFIAMHCSIRTMDHLGEVLTKFKDSSFTSLRMHRTKCSGVIKNIIAPVLLCQLIEDIGDMGYSLIIDESTDISTVKYLCLCVRYFSVYKNIFSTDFLGLIVIENGSAEELYKCTKEYLEKQKLPIKNLLGIGTDGANSLCGNNHSLWTLLKSDVPNLKLVRCVCHSLNNASAKASKQLPANIEFMCKEIYNWFSHSSNRRIQYKKIFDLINTNESKTMHKFIQPSFTRWLAMYNSVKVILENWIELRAHFNLVIENEKCYVARMLREMLNDDVNYLYFKFLKPILHELNQQNLNFQQTNLNVTEAYTDLENLFCVMCRKIYKPIFIKSGTQTLLKEINNELAFLSVSEADYGIDYYQALTTVNISSETRKTLEHKMYAYIKQLCYELSIRLPISLQHFKKFKFLSPQICLSQMRPNFKDLPFLTEYVDSDKLGIVELQYLKLLDVDWTLFPNSENIYKFWGNVFNFQDAGGNYVFRELGKYAVFLLSLPSSNAVVERTFSVMNNIKTKCRNRLDLVMCESLLRLRIHLYNNNICCKDFIVDKEMINKFISAIIYQNNETHEHILEAFNADDNSLICAI